VRSSIPGKRYWLDGQVESKGHEVSRAPLHAHRCSAGVPRLWSHWRRSLPRLANSCAHLYRSRSANQDIRTDSEAQGFNVRANHEFERAALLLVIAGGAFWAFGGEWRRRKRQGAGNRSTDAVPTCRCSGRSRRREIGVTSTNRSCGGLAAERQIVRQTPSNPGIREVDVDQSVSRAHNRRAVPENSDVRVHVPSTCILLLVLGVIKSVWTAALLMIGGIGVVIRPCHRLGPDAITGCRRCRCRTSRCT